MCISATDVEGAKGGYYSSTIERKRKRIGICNLGDFFVPSDDIIVPTAKHFKTC